MEPRGKDALCMFIILRFYCGQYGQVRGERANAVCSNCAVRFRCCFHCVEFSESVYGLGGGHEMRMEVTQHFLLNSDGLHIL